MSKDSKLTRVKTVLTKNPKLTADMIVKQMGVTKVYAYNLLSSARKQLGFVMQHDGTWKMKERMEGTRPATRDEKISNPSVYEVPADGGLARLQAAIRFADAQHDVVNHPPHYKTGGIEVIDFIEAKSLNYHLGNVVKYIARADHKGDRLENLKKAQWYLEREIANASK